MPPPPSQPRCLVCSLPAPLKCSRCRSAHYCSAEHQRQHWKLHKRACSRAAPSASAAGAAMRELQAGVATSEIEGARRDLQAAREEVARLRREAEAAARTLDDASAPSPDDKSAPSPDGASAPSPSSSKAPSYGSQQYWEQSYSSPSVYTASPSYEWYMSSLPRFLPLFTSLLPAPAASSPTRLLDVGCGNSALLSYLLSCNLISAGIGADYSPSVIKTLNDAPHPPALAYHSLDLTDPIPSAVAPPSSLSAAIDKGTTDAILSGGGDDAASSLAAKRRAIAVLLNVLSALREGAPFLVVTNLPPELALPFLGEACRDVSCRAAYDPKAGGLVKAGDGLGRKGGSVEEGRETT